MNSMPRRSTVYFAFRYGLTVNSIWMTSIALLDRRALDSEKPVARFDPGPFRGS